MAKPKRSDSTEHDNSYKQLFSHPRMIKDLLQGFIRQQWISQLDFRTLTKVSGHYVSDDLRDREDDIIWKIRWLNQPDQWLYIYLLIEFQSRVDRFMAVRIMVYIGLLYQDLIKAGAIPAGEKLPPVLPIVLYNGEEGWYAKKEISELIAPFPTEFSKYAPKLQYLVMDERHDYSDQELLSQLNNLVAILFRLEKSRTKPETQQALKVLRQWLKNSPPSLILAFRTWFRRVKLPRHLPGEVLPELSDLQEIENMLETTADNWLEQAKDEGRQQGRQEGRQEGIQEGFQEGLRKVLVGLLEQKFGSLNEETKATVSHFSETGLLEECAKRVLTAKTVQEVLKPVETQKGD